MKAAARRIGQVLAVTLGVVSITFLLIHLVPGDPARTILGTRATPEAVAALRAEMRLDQSLPAQFVGSLTSMATGDLGHSLVDRGRSVVSILGPALVVTLALVGATVLVSVAVSVPLGLWAAMSQRRGARAGLESAATVLLAMPPFFVGLALLWLVALRLGAAPAGGWEAGLPELFEYLWLPAIALSCYLGPLVFRTVVTAGRETLEQDFVEAAVARGLRPAVVTVRHVLPNTLLPVITLVGLTTGVLISGAVVVEAIFDLPGLGSALVLAVSQRDYPVIQGATLIAALGVVVINLLTDGIYRFADPRTTHD